LEIPDERPGIMTKTHKKILDSDLTVINIGMTIFYDALKVQNIKVIQVDWKPGPVLDKLSEEILSKIM
jgi:alpha-D-ribose 1-methylphosphonate 5-triphosphate diphosphatase PhnM